jgi:hypothetical protein
MNISLINRGKKKAEKSDNTKKIVCNTSSQKD